MRPPLRECAQPPWHKPEVIFINFYSTQRNVLYAGWNNAFKKRILDSNEYFTCKIKNRFSPSHLFDYIAASV